MDKNDDDEGGENGRCFCCRKMVNLMCSHLGLCLLLLGYLLLGAIVFSELESNQEIKRANRLIDLRNLTIQKLWNITMDTNILNEKNWTSMTHSEILSFQRILYQSFSEGFNMLQVNHQSKSFQWSFTGSFLYSFTLITTLGK